MARKKKRKRSRDYREIGGLERGKIYPNYYYIWTYWTSKYIKRSKALTEKSLYMKKICGIPYLSRYHAKHVAFRIYGSDVLSAIHVVKGRYLIRHGITHLKVNRKLNYIDYNGKLKKLWRWWYPPEYMISLRRKRVFQISNMAYWKLHNKKEFNAHYKKFFIGDRDGISRKRVKNKQWKVRYQLLEADPDKVTQEDLDKLAKKLENYNL